jgi:MRG-binding protein
LNTQDLESEGYLSPKSNSSAPISIGSPSPNENLAAHPFFREEFSLPFDEEFETIISQRRMRATVSAPSSPAASPIPVPLPLASIASSASSSTIKHGGGSRKRGKYTKSKLNLAGLVSGDSDSSALTQESGDEAGAVETPLESVVTGTDAGTDYAEDEDVEMRDPSLGVSLASSIHFEIRSLILLFLIVSS